jgi:hypothetical protein
VIVLLAARHDAAARRLAVGWPAPGALVLTCDDMCTSGWRYEMSSPALGTAVVGGRKVPVGEIEGVITRLPAIPAEDLDLIVDDDRDYVAAEMTAFLAAWLDSLECPVLNRPSPTCLMGPNWRPEEWLAAAAALGISVRPGMRRVRLSQRYTPANPSTQLTTVTVIGERCVGAADKAQEVSARRLATRAGVEFMAAHFDGNELVAADLWPDINSLDVSFALMEFFSARQSA